MKNTMTEPTQTARRAGRRADLRRPAQRRDNRAAAVPDRLADGRRRLRHPGRATSRSHRRHLRPARRRTQHQGRPDDRVDARSARRRPASDHPGEVGGPVDLFASSGGAVNALALVAKHPEDVRTLVAHEPPAAAVLPDRENAHGRGARHQRDVQAQRLGRRDGALHRRRQPRGRVPRRLRQPARARPRDVRDADRGRRLADRRDARAEHDHLHALRARLRRAAVGVDADRHGRRASRARARWPTAARTPSPNGSDTSRSIFPSDHGGFMGGEYGQAGEPEAFAAKLREVLAPA